MLRAFVSPSRFALAIVCSLAASCSTTQTTYPIEGSVADFNSTSSARANDGYRELYAHRERSIPLLLANADDTTPFAGDAYQNPKSSIRAVSPPSRGLVSLYLVEAIRAGLMYPHQTAALVPARGTTAPTGDPRTIAAAAYRRWWDGLADKSLAAIRKAADPLEGTGLQWLGPASY